MTIPHYADAPPLRGESDVLDRVRALVGSAGAIRQIWIMFVDGDAHQLPTVLPISGLPDRPERRLLQGLERLLAGMRPEIATGAGPGTVIFTLERPGGEEILPLDHEWRDALRVTCSHARVAFGGMYLASDTGVRQIDGPSG